MKAELKRDKKVTVRFSETESEQLMERAKRARTTPSRYIRAAVLTPNECRLPPYEELRELRNTIIQTAALLRSSPKAMDALIGALDRISRF